MNYNKALLQRRNDFNEYEYLIMHTLCAHADMDGYCWPSLRTIQEYTGIGSLNTIRKYLDEMSERGHIAISSRGRGQAFTILWDVEIDEQISGDTNDTITDTKVIQKIDDCITTVSNLEVTVSLLCQKIDLLCQSLSGDVIPKKEEVEDEEVEEPRAHSSERFVEMWQSEPVSTTEQKYIEAVKSVVCNPQDVKTIRLVANDAIGYDLEPEDIISLFGENSYWYQVSFGRDGKPPYAKNVLNELRAAVMWRNEQANKPPEQDDDLVSKLFQQIKEFARGRLSKSEVDPRAQAAVARDTALYYDIKNNLTNQNERFVYDRFKANLSYVH